MKKLVCLLMLFALGCPVWAEIQPPSWDEFCPYKYSEAIYREYKNVNPLLVSAAFIAQVATLNIIPVYWNINNAKSEVDSNNYWVDRRQQFNNEISMCRQSNNEDSTINCYMNIRQLETNKNAQRRNDIIARESQRLQKIQNVNLNGIRYGY